MFLGSISGSLKTTCDIIRMYFGSIPSSLKIHVWSHQNVIRQHLQLFLYHKSQTSDCMKYLPQMSQQIVLTGCLHKMSFLYHKSKTSLWVKYLPQMSQRIVLTEFLHQMSRQLVFKKCLKPMSAWYIFIKCRNKMSWQNVFTKVLDNLPMPQV